MPKIIAVIGATGTQGGCVAQTFSQLSGWEVRGLTRNPSSSAARQLESLGVKLMKADLDDVSSLTHAFTGAHAIFGVTDFWQFMNQPSTAALAAAKEITWNEACYLQEVQQGQNIIDAAAQVVEQGGPLERLVLSSLSDAKRASKGKYTWVWHFDSKARFVQYLEERAQKEPGYRKLREMTSYLQMGYYLDNWKKNPIFMPRKNSNGTVVFRSISANPSTGGKSHPTPFVHPPRDTGPFVEALILRAPPRTTMLGTCSLMDYAEYVKLWGEIHGVKTVVEFLGIDEVIQTWPGGFGIEVGQTACYVREFGWDGGEGAVLPEEAGVDKASISGVATYIKSTDWSSVLD